jgi:hypothetical protein
LNSETVTSSLLYVEVQKPQLWIDDVSEKVLNEDITINVMQLKTFIFVNKLVRIKLRKLMTTGACVLVSVGICIPVGCIAPNLCTHTLSLYMCDLQYVHPPRSATFMLISVC